MKEATQDLQAPGVAHAHHLLYDFRRIKPNARSIPSAAFIHFVLKLTSWIIILSVLECASDTLCLIRMIVRAFLFEFIASVGLQSWTRWTNKKNSIRFPAKHTNRHRSLPGRRVMRNHAICVFCHWKSDGHCKLKPNRRLEHVQLNLISLLIEFCWNEKSETKWNSKRKFGQN